ncbi:MAG: leucine--tRNA ligase [Verrucomicrobia bacterium]|nr:MAG: leucine--tRNA ligase [Verrucomicrobiota bacterium]
METKEGIYDFLRIEKKWQEFWDEDKTFRAIDFDSRPKYYVLDMFPYPSGEGLHIGHPEGYTATDIVGRYKRAKGYNVLHPMGWDAFGLPAEQHAIVTGVHPAINTRANINNFRKQLKSLGLGLDWDREVDTTDPNYYGWTQWIFLQLFKNGLAYVDEYPVWWCEALGTVLANEEVINGRSERGNHPVERRKLRQWVLRITAFADELLEGLKDLNWPDSTKRQQIAWIGRSEGVDVYFELEEYKEEHLVTFTTCVDTLYGVSYIAMAPEHPLIKKLIKGKYEKDIEAYIVEAAKKSDLQRTDLAKDKSGVFTGSYAINPINNERVPIWIADYVLMSYGTGVVMGVPSHDERDYEFAVKYDLPIRPVLTKDLKNEKPEVPFFGKGYLINSGEFNGLKSEEAKVKITESLEKKHRGHVAVNYKLRDWLFSRQRYWGEPFPVIWVEEPDYNRVKGMSHSALLEMMPKEPVTYDLGDKRYFALPVAAEELPQILPVVDSYQPSGGGESPLAGAEGWLNVYLNIIDGEMIPAQGEMPGGGEWVRGHRETNTMPQWAGSCWYYLRYCDPINKDSFVDPKLEKYWGTPDLYIGGAEHAVLHLLYARFWHRVLYRLGLLTTQEPFSRVVHQGLILGEPEHRLFKDKEGKIVSAELVKDGMHVETGELLESVKLSDEEVVKKGEGFVLKMDEEIQVESRAFKMSKSRGNVVSPDAIIKNYGADSLRLYEMFLGPLEAMKPWNTKGIEGVSRFLKRVWREYIDPAGGISKKISENKEEAFETEKILQETIKKVSEDIEGLHFNTAISQMMIFLNHLTQVSFFTRETAKRFLQILAPFAPHIAEELWSRLGEKASIVNFTWPKFDETKLVSDEGVVIFQVNGKMRAEITVSKKISEEEILKIAKGHERIVPYLEGKTVVKVIYVPGKILNMVVK